ncbi:MAG TPA: cellulase family glycosylhydrolase [Ktedonobacteraceae bacterium]|nr:cellulase family glycosylhydrolase [Ktedonobacteraceae bacterium]
MIHVDGSHFKDEHGRTLMLRGVNLGGSSKVPATPDGATYIRDGFFDHRHVSFVGRPFPLEEADEHFTRLRSWGLTFLRFLVTWEAIEHAGPGVYDEAYLDYIYQIVKKAGEYGMLLFIDPHQDMWSRFSGGDGAPGWTLEAAGFDMTHFSATGAAIVHATHGDPFPEMIWPTNSSKLASATMFTLFFGGDDFAPTMQIDSEPIQAYLQRHYINTVRQVALRLKDLPHVIGYDTMNEPLRGYIGWRDLNAMGGLISLGVTPTPYQSMLLGAGLPQEVACWKLGVASVKRDGTRILNSERQRAWSEGSACVWRQHGVWDFDAAGVPHLLRPDYFAQVNGRAVDFAQDYYRPFANSFAGAIRAIDANVLIFIETEAGKLPPQWRAHDEPNIVYAPHWYDGMVLFKKNYSPFLAIDSHNTKLVVGPSAIRQSFAEQLAFLKRGASERLGGVPVLLGEFGIPFDLKEKQAYRTGNFRVQIRALDRSFQAIEANLLNCTLWNYTSGNTNQRGDLWNDEDLSIFSRDQQMDPNSIDSGGRALEAVVRPYPCATAGEPLRMSFNIKQRVFEFTFRHAPHITAPTEIYIPHFQYPHGYNVAVSDGSYEILREQQTLIYWHSMERDEHTIRVRPAL